MATTCSIAVPHHQYSWGLSVGKYSDWCNAPWPSTSTDFRSFTAEIRKKLLQDIKVILGKQIVN